MRRLATALETAAIYVGAIVGAGFASGREVYVFFSRHGAFGPLAAASAGLLLGIVAAAFLPAAIGAGVSDYAALCRFVAGRSGRACEALLSVFLFAGLSVMLAAGATVIALHAPFSYSTSVVLMALITLVFVALGSRGIAAANSWLVPYLVVAVLAVAIAAAAGATTADPLPSQPTASNAPLAWSTLLYVGYNFVTGIAVLLSLPRADAGQRAAGALLGGGGLAAMLAVAAGAILTRSATLAAAPMPLLTLARAIGPVAAVLYVPAIGAAILTTAVGDAYALARRFSPGHPWLAGAASVVLAMPLANRGFVVLVDKGYPLLGMAGLVFIGLAIWRIARPKQPRC